MHAKKQIIVAALSSVVFFAAMWIMDDLTQGIGYDRIAPTALTAIGFGLFTYFGERWLDRRAQRKRGDHGPRPSFRDIIGAIRAIIRQDRTP
jgi:hypothetical protein